MSEACTPEYYDVCDPQAVAAGDGLALLAVWLVAVWLIMFTALRWVPWDRVRAWRWTPRPCCDVRRFGTYEARTLTLGLSIILLGFVFVAPMASAAPDTPPSLTWTADLGFTDCETTQGDARYGVKLVDMAVDTTGNVYGLAACADGIAAGAVGTVVFAYNSAGTLLWSDFLDCGGAPANSCEPGGITYVPIRSGTLAVSVTDNSLLSTAKQALLFVNATTGGITNRFQEDFTNNIPVVYGTTSSTDPSVQLAARMHNATTADFFGVSLSSGRWGVRCTGINTANCTKLFDVVTSPQGAFVGWGGQSNDQVYSTDTNPVTNFIINVNTGAAVNDTANTATSRSSHYYRASGTDVVRLLDSSSTSLRWARHNKDTLAETVENPTENQVFYTGSARSTDAGGGGYLDGADNLFFAGRFTVTGPISYVAKYNSTNGLSGMRWNITVDNCDGSLCSSSAVESFLRPLITQDGALVVGNVYDRGGSGTDDSTWSQIRYYAGAGTPRGDEFTGFESESSGSGGGGDTSNTDAATGLLNFCTSMGFETSASLFLCGLVLVAVVMVVLVAATSSFTQRGNVALVVGGIGGIGMMLFNGFAGIWDFGVTAIFAMVGGGIVAYYARQGLAGG